MQSSLTSLVVDVSDGSGIVLVTGRNHRREKQPEEGATGTTFVARPGDNHPCSFAGSEPTRVVTRGMDRDKPIPDPDTPCT